MSRVTNRVAVGADKLMKSFAGRQALDGVSVEWRPGCVIGVAGPNGAGKSTLLDILSGRVLPDAGRIWIDGVETTGWSMEQVSRLRLVRLFQGGNVIQRLTVLENVLMAAESDASASLSRAVLGNHDHRAEQLASETLTMFAFERFSEIPAGQLSHGQRKILSMAMCFAASARVLLLDEPFSGVDNHWSDTLCESIRRLRSAGALVVVIEHDLERLSTIADEMIVMQLGRIVGTSSPSAGPTPNQHGA